MPILSGRVTCRSLHDVAGNGERGRTKLSTKPIALLVRERPADAIHFEHEVIGDRKHPQLAVVSAHTRRRASIGPYPVIAVACSL
jgi:hypothetical protein